MPKVTVERLMIEADADLVWAVARDILHYPDFMKQVISIEPIMLDDGTAATSWVVLFNGNELRWTETDDFDDQQRRVTFAQIEGDLADWSGYFEARLTGQGVLGRYEINFDLGIPALAELLHPLGEVAIRANCEQMLEEMERQGMRSGRSYA